MSDDSGKQTEGRRQKRPDAFFTIGETSAELGVEPHVLRFWETKFSRLKPMTRAGGRRYYRLSDRELLRTIKRLLYEEGYTIKGAQQYLRRGQPAQSHITEEPLPGASIPVAAAASQGGSTPSPSTNAVDRLADRLRGLAGEVRMVAETGKPPAQGHQADC